MLTSLETKEIQFVNKSRWYYIIALMIIAAMIVFSYFLTQQILFTHDGFAKKINDSGRQRMLSQRIISYMLQDYLHPSIKSKDEIKKAKKILLFTHKSLSKPFKNEKKSADPFYQTMHKLYFLGNSSISLGVIKVSSLVDNYLSNNDNSKKIIIEELANLVNFELLDKLNKAVLAYQKESEYKMKEVEHQQKMVLYLVLLVLILEARFIFHPLFNKVYEYIKKLSDLATRDELTDLLNRREFDKKYCELIEYAKRYTTSCSVILMDIDNFKAVNDNFGHVIGDLVIKKLAQTISKITRKVDLCFRYGGEEFVILMPQTSINDAYRKSEDIRKAIENLIITYFKNNRELYVQVTVTIGLSVITNDNYDNAFEQADKALYQGKEKGKNQVVMYPYEFLGEL